MLHFSIDLANLRDTSGSPWNSLLLSGLAQWILVNLGLYQQEGKILNAEVLKASFIFANRTRNGCHVLKSKCFEAFFSYNYLCLYLGLCVLIWQFGSGTVQILNRQTSKAGIGQLFPQRDGLSGFTCQTVSVVTSPLHIAAKKQLYTMCRQVSVAVFQ